MVAARRSGAGSEEFEMARYIGPVCKLCRREGMKLYLKGERCYSEKCAYTRRPYPPGQHGQGRIKLSEYAVRLREKQKVRRVYGVLERQFRGYFDVADQRSGVTGESLLRFLELRLDNVVYRLGFASSRAQARQLVSHGHFAVNGVPTNIPSFQLKPGDRIEVRESHTSREPFKLAKETLRNHQAPEWLSMDAAKLSGSVAELPRRDQMPLDLNEQLVVEYYSR
jgi:small subunit ribosomal protein S4